MPLDPSAPSSRSALAEAIAAVPRVPLARLPTPLHCLSALGEAWGAPDLWIKRDDLSGLAFGGNKVRKLEFLAAHAQQRGARTLVTAGRVQSNHTRDTAIVARRLGMDAAVVLSGTRPEPATANVLLEELMGVQIAWADGDRAAYRQGVKLLTRLKLGGGRPYYIPPGGANPRGCVGYVAAVLELATQCEELGEPLPDAIVVPVGTGGTLAGLIAGCRLLQIPTQVIGIGVVEAPHGRPRPVAKLATATGKFLGFKETRIEADAVHVDTDYLGPGYSLATPKSTAAIATMAQYEGIFLDPCYTGKGLAGLHGLLERGVLDPARRLLFWHTGGQIALFR